MVDIFESLGRSDALKLRNEAKDLTGTQIISRGVSIPKFDHTKDYTSWPINSPVSDQGQIWLLLQPHNAAHQTGRPRTLRALWGLAHTTDPSRAKYWVDPYGTSNMCMKRDCYEDTYGTVYRCLLDNTVHDAKDLPTSLEVVS